MFNKDNKYKLNTSKPEKKAKKEKAEKAPKEKKEGGKLFGGKGFGKESGGKLSDKAPKKEKKSLSFSFKKKEKEGKISNDFSKGGGKLSEGGSKRSFKERFAWVKWWHIVIAAVALILIIAGIVFAVILGRINNTMDDDPMYDPDYEPEGTVTTVGTYMPIGARECILSEYTEYFSGKKTVVFQKKNEIRFDYKAYYVLASNDGELYYDYSGEYTGEKTPEAIKSELLNSIKNEFGYSNEKMAQFDVKIFMPVSFTKVKLSSATLTSDNKVTVKYQAGAIDGELSAEYTLNGTYTKNENNFTFAYTNLPEDAALRRVADNVLKSAKYDYYDAYGSWMNTLTFGDILTLSFTTDVE
ncbi:MAG: hypothetical protein IJ445_03720 [Clostridia bacterium]|nr:hypothetical protein [Clostridia bacterium]